MSGILSEGIQVGDKYVVKKKLGQGGMSIVWLVEGKTGERYAVKEPIISGVSDEDVRRNVQFVEHEGKILRMIQHPNICKLYDMKRGRLENKATVLLFLEYLDGGSLRDIPEPLDARKLRDVATQILEGLAEVHGAGVVHRDIKPSNVMSSKGVYKLVDFGTAVHHFERALHVVVSPGGYTAPEQLQYGLAVPQADIWSVGATLVWAYTRQHPYKFMNGYDKDRLVGPVKVMLPPTGDDLLDAFLAKALEPDYRRRFADAAEALAFLKGVAAKEKQGLRLKLMGHIINVNQGQLIIGRTDEKEKHLKIEGNLLYIYDAGKYISRQHAEITEIGGKWYIRDLGSVNKTAVLRDNEWIIVWRGRGVTSQWIELKNGDIVALGYDKSKGPYIVMTVSL